MRPLQAIEIVTEAIACDNAGEFEKALGLYKRWVMLPSVRRRTPQHSSGSTDERGARQP